MQWCVIRVCPPQNTMHRPPQQSFNQPPPPSSHTDVVDLLRQFCLDHLKMAPIYTYHNFGNTNLVTTTISLPNGEKVHGNPCANKLEAASNAAEKALAFLQSSVKPAQIPANKNFMMQQYNPIYPSQLRQHMPPPLPPFSYYPAPPPPPQFLPMAGFRPPAGQYPPPPPPQYWGRHEAHFDQPLMRHPQPLHSTHIPESFSKANQRLLLSDSEPIPPPVAPLADRPPTQPPQSLEPCNNGNQFAGKDVFFLPGGSLVTVPQKGSESSSMFVPAQVMKHSFKAPVDTSLSKTEWPDLPAPPKVVPQAAVPPKVAPVSEEKNVPQNTYSNVVVSNVSSVDNSIKNVAPKEPPAPKKTKRRLAANFQFAN